MERAGVADRPHAMVHGTAGYRTDTLADLASET